MLHINTCNEFALDYDGVKLLKTVCLAFVVHCIFLLRNNNIKKVLVHQKHFIFLLTSTNCLHKLACILVDSQRQLDNKQTEAVKTLSTMHTYILNYTVHVWV